MVPEHIDLLEQCIAELTKYEALKEWAKDYTPQTRAEYARIHTLIDRCKTFVRRYHHAEEDYQQGHA